MLGCIVYILLSGVVCIATGEVCRKITLEKVKSLGYVSLLEKKQTSFRGIIENFTPIWSNLKTLFSISSIVEIFSLRDEEWKNVLDKNANFVKLDSFDKNTKLGNESQDSVSNEVALKKDTLDKTNEDSALSNKVAFSLAEPELDFTLSDGEEKVDSVARVKVKRKTLYQNIGKK